MRLKERIRRSLLERVSLEGICRVFDVSMPWLLGFMEKTFQSLPDDLNATVIAENDEFEVAVLETCKTCLQQAYGDAIGYYI